MAFDPTNEVGLPKNLTYTDLFEANSLTHCVARDFPYDVVLSYDPNDTAHTYLAQGWMRGKWHPTRWGRIWKFQWDSTAGGWKPYAADTNLTNGYTRFWVKDKYAPPHQGEYIVECTAANVGKDAVTSKGWYMPLQGEMYGNPFYNVGVVNFRYDLGVDGCSASEGVWRLSNWAKNYSYDWLSNAESGFQYDVVVPYVTASLAVGTTAVGYAFNTGSGGADKGEWWNNNYGRYRAGLASTGVAYTCMQVEPVHIWQKV